MFERVPEAVLLAALLVIGIIYVETKREEKPIPVVGNVHLQGVQSVCHFGGRYWNAKPSINGTFTCNIKDAP